MGDYPAVCVPLKWLPCSMSLCRRVKGLKRPRMSSTFFLYSVSCGICSSPA